jgi:FMN-dependent NADH-azoreductase
MKILHIDSSILGESSASRVLSAALVDKLLSEDPEASVSYRDLATKPVSHLDGAIAAGFRQPATGEDDESISAEHQQSEELVQELLDSDVIVVGAPMYNFTIPTQLKAWLDRIAQQGRTFRYTENGSIGLAKDKAVIIASTRGGTFPKGNGVSMDFHETYLKAFFNFIGITHVTVVRAESLAMGPELRSQSIRSALASVSKVVASILSS